MNVYFIKQYGWLVLSVCVWASCNSKGNPTQKTGPGAKGPVQIDAAIAELAIFENDIEMSGTIQASEQVMLKPEIGGRIVFLNIPEGKSVKAGTLLMSLYNDDIKAQKRKTEYQLDLSRKTELRLKQLLEVNGLNRQEYDVALNSVQTLEAELEQLNAQLRKTEIRAPFDGVLGLRRVSEGAIVSGQDIIASLQQISRLKVDFLLPEIWSDAIKQGRAVKLRTATGTLHEARIEAIEPLLSTGSRNLQVRAVIIGQNTGLSPGAFVTVLLNLAEGRKSILIPTNSVIPETRFKKVVLIKNGKADFVTVETGYRGQGLIEITRGLSPGDTFALNGILYLKPGSEVLLKSIKQGGTAK